MESIFDYCARHVDVLNGYRQPSFNWSKNYEINRIEEFLKNKNVIIPLNIDRSLILEAIIKKKHIEAFVMIMLWGGIGISPGRSKAKRTSIFLEVINHIFKDSDLLEALNDMKNDESLFNNLLPGGRLKIPNVDISYFTKLLAFWSQAKATRLQEFELLIYDKWTRLLHINLLLEDGDGKLYDLYSRSSINSLYSNGKISLIRPKRNFEFEAYVDYCKRVSGLTYRINQKFGLKITSMELEEYLFGFDLRGKSAKAIENPRFWMIQKFGYLN